MMKRVLISVAVLVVFGALLYGLFAYKAMVEAKMAYAMAHRKMPPVVVIAVNSVRLAGNVGVSAKPLPAARRAPAAPAPGLLQPA